MFIRSITFNIFLALSLIITLSAELRAESDKNRDYHSAHVLMNYGLNMIADGSSMIISTDMDIKTSVVQNPINYGKETIDLGKSFVERALKGPDMVEKHVQKNDEESDMMLATHKLGQLMLQAVYSPEFFESDLLKNSEIAHNLLVIQLEANNALMMSAQGSNAREVILDLLHGKEMKKISNDSLNPSEKELYEYTRKQLINSVDIINLLYRMEFDE